MKYGLLASLMLMVIIETIPAKQSSDSPSLPTIAQKTTSMTKYPGFLTFYWDERSGKIWLEIDRWEQEFLYLNSLPAGIGSNDIGLDRGQLGQRRIVKFQRIGPKILLVQPNYSFRAITDNRQERKAVEEAFARSVIWGFEVAAETDQAVLVDASAFFLRDAHDIIGTLKNTGQGNYTLELSRSAVYLPGSKNFPHNTEVETILTFTGDSPGEYVEQVVPSPQAITVRQHHSLVKLPDDGYQPRKLDPRAGYFGIDYLDYAAPLGEPLRKQFIARHRLKKKDPSAPVSEALEPIVYYLDGGVPEPMRSALLEGARWWNQAFEAAGYKDAFQVKILPEEVDPMDVRYNVIQWVHRATRGWSYGDAVIDPRTGEIIKGHITLGSLRVRQDFLIAEGLLAPYESGKPVPREMQEMALMRLRQLAAHEVGHTLGLAHNFAASANHRASVMDYPHPLVQIRGDSTLDLSQAYAVGIGAWDKVAIQYGYQDFPENVSEKEALDGILREGFRKGLIFISDEDARPAGGAHPLAHLWDNGEHADEELQRLLKVRRIALHNFSEKNIPEGTPMAALEEVLAPLYFSHRYQLEAAAKLVGGLYYTYALRGDGQTVTAMVPSVRQRQALNVLLETLRPETLAFPEQVLEIIPPRAYGLPRTREDFNTRSGVAFDPLAAAETAANLAVRLILHPERAARLIEYHARDADYPGLEEVIERLIEATWKASPKPGYPGEIQRAVNGVVLANLLQLAGNQAAALQARALASLKLGELREWIVQRMKKTRDTNLLAHYSYTAAQIKKFQENPDQIQIVIPLDPPAGSPIGAGGEGRFECGFMPW